MELDALRFPSGRSVGRARKDAKQLAKAEGLKLAEALDKIAQANGLELTWAAAMARLQETVGQSQATAGPQSFEA